MTMNKNDACGDLKWYMIYVIKQTLKIVHTRNVECDNSKYMCISAKAILKETQKHSSERWSDNLWCFNWN